jgi:hypothetical protein
VNRRNAKGPGFGCERPRFTGEELNAKHRQCESTQRPRPLRRAPRRAEVTFEGNRIQLAAVREMFRRAKRRPTTGDRRARTLAGIRVMAKLKGYSGRFDSRVGRAGPSLRELLVGFAYFCLFLLAFCLFSA